MAVLFNNAVMGMPSQNGEDPEATEVCRVNSTFDIFNIDIASAEYFDSSFHRSSLIFFIAVP